MSASTISSTVLTDFAWVTVNILESSKGIVLSQAGNVERPVSIGESQLTYGGALTWSLGQNAVLTASQPGQVVGRSQVTLTLYPSASLTAAPTTQPSTGSTASLSGSSIVSGSSPARSSGTITVTPVPLPNSVVKNKGVTNGAAAGIAVGCLLAGAIISALVLCFLFRRKKREGQHNGSGSVASLHRERGRNSNAKYPGSNGQPSQTIENVLPMPLEDKAISGDVNKISTLIKNHVQSYYHSGRVSPGILDLTDLQALGEDLPISTGTLSTLLANSTTRDIALRFVIAWVVISRIRLPGDPHTTFLPSEISWLLHSISSNARLSPLFLSKWRAFTSMLTQPIYGTSTLSASDNRSLNIQKALNVLDGILHPYADLRMENQRRLNNLEEILKRAAAFGFTLFSQPSSWDFDWRNEQSLKSGSLCIFPALVQTTDEAGEILSPPRELHEALIRTLDG